MARLRRHPAQVTLDRLVDSSIAYDDRLNARERKAIGVVSRALMEIARGDRDVLPTNRKQKA